MIVRATCDEYLICLVFLQNAAVVGTVLGVIILFIPFCVLCRKWDKKDKVRVRTHTDNYQ